MSDPWAELDKKYGGSSAGKAAGWDDLDAKYSAMAAAEPTPMPVRAAPKESAAFAAGRNAPGALRGLANVMQGPTLGFGDEIYGGIRAALSGFRPGAYTEARDMARGASAQASEDNPIFSQITQLMSGAPLMALNPGAPAVTMTGRAAQAGVLGAGLGAASGAGKSNEDTASGVALDAGIGGLLGGVTSAAAVPVQQGILTMGGNAIAKVLPSSAERRAAEKVAEALARDQRGTVQQTSPDAAMGQAAARLRKLGPEARVVDLGGANTRGLLDINATLPGATKDLTETAIRARQAGRGDRLINAASESLQTKGQRLSGALDDWMADRRALAGPLYKQLHGMSVPADPQLDELIDAALKLGAGGPAKRMAVADRVPFTLDPKGSQHSMRDLDALKQGIDALIEKQTDLAGKVSKEGVSLIGLKKDLLSKLDGATGGLYQEARAAYAGPSALMDAARRGRDVFKGNVDALEATVKGLQGSERDAFQLGAFEALRGKLGKESGQTEILKLWKEPATAERLKAVFGDERAFRYFYAQALKEGRLKGLDGIGRGSQTAARQFAEGDLDVSAVQNLGQAVGSAASGNPVGLLAAGSRAWNSIKTPEPVRDAMGRLLLRQGEDAYKGLLDLSAVMADVQRKRAAEVGAAGLLGGGILAPAGSAWIPR